VEILFVGFAAKRLKGKRECRPNLQSYSRFKIINASSQSYPKLHKMLLHIFESKVLSKNEKQASPIWNHIHMPACILANGDNSLLYIL
jgi:hypothetical protein